MLSNTVKMVITGQFLRKIANVGKNSFELLTFLANGADTSGIVNNFTSVKDIYAGIMELTYSGVQRHIVKLEQQGLIKKIKDDKCVIDEQVLKIMVPNRLFQYCGKCKHNTPHDDNVKRSVIICTECGHEKKYKIKVNDQISG